jgi:hypothetical protein
MATYLILIITEFVTIFFIALGYLIKYRKRIDLIRGYDRNQVSDPAGLSRWVGNNLLILGGIGVIILIIEFLFTEFELLAATLFLAVAVPVVGLITAYGSRRFENRDKGQNKGKLSR